MGWALLRKSVAAVFFMGISASPVLAQVVMGGVSRAKVDLKLSLPVSGRVEQLRVSEGTKVIKGELILSLDKTLEELEVVRRRLLLDDLSKLHELQIREAVLREQVAKARTLLAAQLVSSKQVEDEEIVYQDVVAQLGALTMAKKREKVEYELAREALARRVLLAPTDGTISKVNVREGESLGVNESAVSLVDITVARFVGSLAANDAARLRIGMTGRLAFTRECGKQVRDCVEIVRNARITFVSPVTDAASGLVEVFAEFDNADMVVRPGIAGQMVIQVAGQRSLATQAPALANSSR
jgi:RND family efflux transporter MFP subunit